MQQATSSAPLLVIRGLVVEGRSDQGVSQIIQTMDLTLERGKVLGLIGRTFKPEPWAPVNSLTWGKAMAYNLGGNMDDELLRAALLAKGGRRHCG